MILEEKEKSIERLENDLKKADQREDSLKQLHNNYMLQVQTLINQRAISAPSGSARKAERPVTKTESYQEQEPEKEDKEKKALETTCLNCGDVFTAERKTRKFCSNKCKTAYYRNQEKNK